MHVYHHIRRPGNTSIAKIENKHSPTILCQIASPGYTARSQVSPPFFRTLK